MSIWRLFVGSFQLRLCHFDPIYLTIRSSGHRSLKYRLLSSELLSPSPSLTVRNSRGVERYEQVAVARDRYKGTRINCLFCGVPSPLFL